MKKYFICFIVGFIFFTINAQNNYIVTTEDGKRVLLKADYTWEYIDQIIPVTQNLETAKKEEIAQKITIEPKLKPLVTNCDLEQGFKEPQLNPQIQAFLKRNRSSINQLKKKVAKKENCNINDITLINTSESKAKGTYLFCTCKGKVAYKRNGSSFFKKSNLF